MARSLRLEARGSVHHVIVRGNERKAIFRDERDRERYLERLEHYRERLDFRLYAYCLMDNHVHLAIERGSVPLSRIMLSVQSSYTQWFNRRHRRVGHLFQGRYKAFLVQKQRYLLALVRYIHSNPVKARVVERPQEYVWSSDRYYRRGRGPTWLDCDDVLGMLAGRRSAAVREYRRLMGGGGADEDYENLRAHGQVVKGEEEFAARLLEKAGEQRRARRRLGVEQIVEAVARLERFSAEQLRRPGRFRQAAHLRAVCAFVGRSEGGIPVSQMARFFDRDESTLVRQVLGLEKKLPADARLRAKLKQITQELANT